jgi:hypothetical protein
MSYRRYSFPGISPHPPASVLAGRRMRALFFKEALEPNFDSWRAIDRVAEKQYCFTDYWVQSYLLQQLN